MHDEIMSLCVCSLALHFIFMSLFTLYYLARCQNDNGSFFLWIFPHLKRLQRDSAQLLLPEKITQKHTLQSACWWMTWHWWPNSWITWGRSSHFITMFYKNFSTPSFFGWIDKHFSRRVCINHGHVTNHKI